MAKKPRHSSQSPTQNRDNSHLNALSNSRSNALPKPANSQNGVLVLDKKQARRDAKKIGLNKADLPNSIKEIIATLTEAGFEAYIVGGGVRDALLGLRPKDFDAVTNATPSQIKDVFGKRCRIIGRRFQLAHVYSGRDMIEVATFRAPPKDDTFTTDEGMLMRDNVWGDIYQDAVRRDFSINALYYQPLEGVVYDFCGGLTDVANKTLRLLGDAQKRVEEDPVRLLRALRFKAKLGFRFSTDLENQFNSQNWSFIANVSPHRLYDETQKMFTGGYLVPLLPLLHEYRALEHLIFYPPQAVMPLVERVALNTDKRINEDTSINPAFFYASLLWENYLFLLEKFKKSMPFTEAQHHSANKVMDKQRGLTAMPKFAEQFIKDIWLLQPRLAEPRRKTIQKLFENPRFRAGFDFLHLREMVKNQADFSDFAIESFDKESTNNMGEWWAWFQTLNVKQQQQAIAEFDLEKAKQRFAPAVKNNANRNAKPAKNPVKSEGKTPPKDKNTTRLSQQEQQEKAQLRQLSLANRTPTQAPKPLWEMPQDLTDSLTQQEKGQSEKGQKTDNYAESGYDLENPYDLGDTPRQSRRERRLANQALKQQVSTTPNNLKNDSVKTEALNYENTRSPKNATRNKGEQAIPSARKRREPSSDLTVKERLQGQNSTPQAIDTPSESANKKESKIENQVAVATPQEKPSRTRKPKASVDNLATENGVMSSENLATPPTKIPAKRTRKKVVGSETVKEKTENVPQQVANGAGEIIEKPSVKRGRKPKASVDNSATENVEVLAVKPSKIPAKRTRKKPTE